MLISYKNGNKLINISELRTGDVFLWDENACILLDHSDCSATQTDDFLCARLSDGYIQKFSDDDYVLPMLQSFLEVKQ